MGKLTVNEGSKLLVYSSIIFILLILSLVNIKNFLTVKTVLGANTANNETFNWDGFLKTNPNYIPGWIEIEREDVAKNIDPNFNGLAK